MSEVVGTSGPEGHSQVTAWLRGRRATEALLSGLHASGVAHAVGESVPAIETRGLRKDYGSRQTLRGVDLTVGCGEVFCLLGPNGAGKTTTVEILEGFRSRSGGEVTVLGVDPQ